MNDVSNSIKNNLIANPCTIRISNKKNKLFGDKATDLRYKEMPKAGSYYTCLEVILIDFFF